MKKEIAAILQKTLKNLGADVKTPEIEKYLEIPPSAEMGDYAFPCYFLIPKLKMQPHEIALALREKLGNVPSGFQDVQSSGPYLNFFIDRTAFATNTIKQILKEKANYGKANIGKGKKVLIEHTSINPNASPHVGRARNAILGDSLVKIFDFMNFKPETHYYVNDISKQIAMLVYAEADKLKFEDMLKKYVEITKKVAKSKKVEDEVFGVLFRFEHENKETIKEFRKITETCVKGQKEILAKLGIHYDYFDYESDYLSQAKQVLKKLQELKKLHKDKDGRLYLNQSSDTEIKKKMKSPVLVLTRSDGTGLYPLRDIAYTIHKMKITKDNLIVLGEDQKLYFLQVKDALKTLGYSAPQAVHYSFVMIKEGHKKAKRMATRKGDVILLEDFLNDAIKKAKREIVKRKTKGDAEIVGVGAVKYKMLKNSPNKAIMFDLDEALSFEGDTGPYIQYSYARASSILSKAKNKKQNYKVKNLEEKEIELAKKLSAFPKTALEALTNLNPALIANYSYQLAQTFNEFYHACPVIGSEQEGFRLSLIESFTIVLETALSLLGIKVMKEM